jgi:predicted RNA-binding protein with PUA-like domain
MAEPKQHWIIKQEPTAYAWETFCGDGRTAWTGVRNFQARNNLRLMRVGDWALYYHSVVGKELVGVAEVVRVAYPDPTAQEGDWSCVDVVPKSALVRRVNLDELKAHPVLKEIALIRQSRLSVIPITAGEFTLIMNLAGGLRPV